MAFSNVVMFAIIVATAITLTPKSGQHLVISSSAQVAAALRPVAGRFASVIFALGFIGSGMLAIPVLAGAGSAGMAGLLGKQTGFSNSPRRAPVFYGLCAVGTVGGMALSLLSVNPITLLVFVAVVNGVAAAPFIVVTMCSFPPIERSWGVSERPSGDAPRMAAGDADGRCCGGAVCNRGRLVRPSLASSSV